MDMSDSRIIISVIGIVAVIPLIFSATVIVSVPIVTADGEPTSVITDVNSDGKVDYVTASGNVLLNVGDNRFQSNKFVFTGTGWKMSEYTFSNGTLAPFSITTADSPSPLKFVDDDGDGQYDAIIFTNYGDLSAIIYRNDGTGIFKPTKSVSVDGDMTPEYFAVVDRREFDRNEQTRNLL